jgi:CDP-glycerol glycerophosphotransferase (TagB/SpsB family)
MSINDCFNSSEAMISDVSSVVNDYLFSEKPFAMVAVSQAAKGFSRSFPVAQAGYVIDGFSGTLRDLDPVLDDLLGADPKAARRRELKTYYLGDIPTDGYADHFVETLRSYC